MLINNNKYVNFNKKKLSREAEINMHINISDLIL